LSYPICTGLCFLILILYHFVDAMQQEAG
jgi:hypothetical protein